MSASADFRELLKEVEPPAGSPERARHYLASRFATGRRRAARPLSVAITLALAAALVLTPAGQATFDAVTGFFSIDDPEELQIPPGTPGAPGTGADVYSGQFPDGTSYSVSATRIGDSDKACFGINLPEATESTPTGYAQCEAPDFAQRTHSKLTYFSLDGGAIVAFCLARADVTDAIATDGGIAKVVPIEGQLEHAGGRPERLPPMSFVIAWLPPGVGSNDSSPPELTLTNGSQKAIASMSLDHRGTPGIHLP